MKKEGAEKVGEEKVGAEKLGVEKVGVKKRVGKRWVWRGLTAGSGSTSSPLMDRARYDFTMSSLT